MSIGRTYVFNDPTTPEREVMVTDYGEGTVEMAFRTGKGVWGPPITAHTVEDWDDTPREDRVDWVERIVQASLEGRTT